MNNNDIIWLLNELKLLNKDCKIELDISFYE